MDTAKNASTGGDQCSITISLQNALFTRKAKQMLDSCAMRCLLNLYSPRATSGQLYHVWHFVALMAHEWFLASPLSVKELAKMSKAERTAYYKEPRVPSGFSHFKDILVMSYLGLCANRPRAHKLCFALSEPVHCMMQAADVDNHTVMVGRKLQERLQASVQSRRAFPLGGRNPSGSPGVVHF
eukprot:3538474-Amphidinium_carterae.1